MSGFAKSRPRYPFYLAALLLLGGCVLFWSFSIKPAARPGAPRGGEGRAGRPPPEEVLHAAAEETRGAEPSPPPAPVRAQAAVAARPLPVAWESATHAWTAADAMRPEIIRLIAHNPVEEARLLQENPTLHRRQLVYRNDPAAAVIQRALAAGEPVERLTLPGLDGEEFEIELEAADLGPGFESGTFAGRLAGRPESFVTLAFKFNTEAFTILSPDDGIYLTADPREPGEVILKEINPELYAAYQCLHEGGPENH